MDKLCGGCSCWSSQALEDKKTDTRWFGKRNIPDGRDWGLCSQANGTLPRHQGDPACPLYNPPSFLGKLGASLEGTLTPARALRKSEGAAQKLLDALAQAVDNEAVLGSEVQSCHKAMVALFAEARDLIRPRTVSVNDILRIDPGLKERPDVTVTTPQFQATCHTAANTGAARYAQRVASSLGHTLRRLNDCRSVPVVAKLIPEVEVGRPGVMHQPPEELEKEGLL